MNDVARPTQLRERLYGSYASTHAGFGADLATDLIYRRDIRPHLPGPGSTVVDIGCGQGQLVRLLLQDGYVAEGIDVSPEQVQIAQQAGLPEVRLGDHRELLTERRDPPDAIVATDFLEHLTRDEVLDTLDVAVRALRPGGVLIARVPNAVSPFGGRIRHGDFTHESSYTPRSVAQVTAAMGFETVSVHACPPTAHGLRSAARALVWKPISGFFKLGLAAETGTLRGHVVTQNLTFIARTPAGRP